MLNYRVIESKKEEWVVFIHPLGGSSATFFNQVRDYKKEFNLLLIDLHGHGKSNNSIDGLTPNDIAKDILNVLDHVNIMSAHFVGMCLGNVVVDLIYKLDSSRMKSITYGAAVKEINLFNRLLLKIGNIVKFIMPHDVLYSIFAYVMMPRGNHKEARRLFIREAKKMNRKNFLDWYNLIMSSQDFYEDFEVNDDKVHKLYIFGSEDHLFISKAQDYVNKDKNASLIIIKDVGHMCNVECPKEFNKHSIEFIKEQKLKEYKKVDKVV